MIQLIGHGRVLLIVFFLSLLLFSFPLSNSSTVFENTMREDHVTLAADFGTIVIDYSHGQESTITTVIEDDALLGTELEAMGYTVIWARGGLNASILSGADGLLIASISGDANVFLTSEIDAITEWFNSASKFLWVGCDSDYTSVPDLGQFINDNMALVLEAVESHVYPEPTSVEDPESNAGSAYRAIANQTSNDPFVSDIVMDVETVLMHGPTLVYGSNNENPGVGIDPVALEDTTIENVYPLLYYSDFARIYDGDITNPIAHDDGDIGAFVAATIEIDAGENENGVIIASGSSPYASYRSMHVDEYNGNWNGSLFVTQAIDFCMASLGPIIDSPDDVTYEEGQDIHELFETIDWHANSTSPKCYNISLDEAPIKDGLWNSSSEEISINIEGLMEGTHNYTITVESTQNKTASDTVFATVLAPAAPVVNHPANITYEVGETGNVIHWEMSDTSFKNWVVYRNGVSLGGTANALDTGPSSHVEDRSVDGYALGLYNWTIVVTDWVGLVSTDTVWVEVISETTTTDTTTSADTTNTTDTTLPTTPVIDGDILGTITLIISIGSIVIIIIVIVLIKRKT